MVIVLATLLSAAPLAAASFPPEVVPARTQRVPAAAFRVRLDVGGLLGASWFVPQGRARIEAALANAGGSLRGESTFDSQGFFLATPGVGPLLLATREGPLGSEERALLIASGALQFLGMTLGASALASGESALPKGPVLSFSPIAGGRLGFAMRLSGF